MFSRIIANRQLVIAVIFVALLMLGANVEKLWPRAGAQSFTSTSPAPLPNTFGAQNTLVMLVNFYDNTSQPFTVDQVHSMIFGTTSNSVLATLTFDMTFIWHRYIHHSAAQEYLETTVLSTSTPATSLSA